MGVYGNYKGEYELNVANALRMDLYVSFTSFSFM